MGCNAWNHPPGCLCNFAGGNRGYIPPPNSGFRWVSGENYAYPNAKCPRCGQLVFFIRPDLGGAVYFDEIGPPWPRHPCMDTDPRPRSVPLTRGDWTLINPDAIYKEGYFFFIRYSRGRYRRLPREYVGGPVFKSRVSGELSFLNQELRPVYISPPLLGGGMRIGAENHFPLKK